MKINLSNLVSISEANQNFSKVARMVDENGATIILKNNAPRYVLIDYNQLSENLISNHPFVDGNKRRQDSIVSDLNKAFSIVKITMPRRGLEIRQQKMFSCASKWTLFDNEVITLIVCVQQTRLFLKQRSYYSQRFLNTKKTGVRSQKTE